MAVVVTFDFGTAAWAMYPTLRFPLIFLSRTLYLPCSSGKKLLYLERMSLFCSLNFPVCLGELPIHNQAIHEAQKPSEDITDSLEVAGVGAFNSVERLMPSLFKLEIQRYRLRVFPITTTVKIG
ncbi:hypothetical protein SORBI_3001G110701 [Sorghum bicolor]|uniref:Uncharacterized protein n=1 Tax=Sorghum bicolor TaxID=4558 RepID=A0A1Z5S5Q6_SORBI|nr:hypothetical protein SORBI_3001G110701 [Sorghum bicolor]